MNVSAGPEWLQYLGRARGLVLGVGALANREADTAFACLFLAGWATEVTLKGLLSHQGCSTEELKGWGHDLEVLWRESAARGLAGGAPIPEWCSKLAPLHMEKTGNGKTFRLRYPDGLNGHVGPNVELVARELETLLHVVERSLLPGPG